MSGALQLKGGCESGTASKESAGKEAPAPELARHATGAEEFLGGGPDAPLE